MLKKGPAISALPNWAKTLYGEGFGHRFVRPARGYEGNVFCRDCGARLTTRNQFATCRGQWKVFDLKKPSGGARERG